MHPPHTHTLSLSLSLPHTYTHRARYLIPAMCHGVGETVSLLSRRLYPPPLHQTLTTKPVPQWKEASFQFVLVTKVHWRTDTHRLGFNFIEDFKPNRNIDTIIIYLWEHISRGRKYFVFCVSHFYRFKKYNMDI